MSKEYRICSCGKPVISTFSFSGAEYWCWSCGKTEGMFCGLDTREITSDELQELKLKKEQAIKFLRARGVKYGVAMRKIKGEFLLYDQLPEEVIKEIDKDADSWVYEKVI